MTACFPLTSLFLLQHSAEDNFGAGLALLVTGGVIYALFYLIRRWTKKPTPLDYRQTSGTITGSRKVSFSSSSGSRIKNYAYTMEFMAAGKKLDVELDHTTLLNKYPVGHTISVFYNPKKPNEFYTGEKQKQDKDFARIQNFAAIVFAAVGIIVLCTVNYNELNLGYQLREMFRPESDESKVGRRFGDYTREEARKSEYTDPLLCDPQLPKGGHKEHTYSLAYFSSNENFNCDINADGKTDMCYLFTLLPCCAEGHPIKEKVFIVLSSGSEYKVDDSFFSRLESDGLGQFRLQGIQGSYFSGEFIPRGAKDGEIYSGRAALIKYPEGKVFYKTSK